MSSRSGPTSPLPKEREELTPSHSAARPSLATGASRFPSASQLSTTSLSSSFEHLSSSEILERVPTPVVRLLASLNPFIHGLYRFIRLATWTGGEGSGSSSMLLLVCFWLACAIGYEFVRYAPQLFILSWIAYTGVRRQLSFIRPRSQRSVAILEKHDVVTAATLNATLAELSELADFFSTFRKNVLLPAIQLISWHPNPINTKAAAVFIIFTWPLWLAAFLPLRESGFPSLVLPVSGVGVLASTASSTRWLYAQILTLVGPENVATWQFKAAPFLSKLGHIQAFVDKTPLPVFYASVLALLGKLRWEQWTEFNITLLPPYPIGALTVRSLVCFLGTLALTWCSPWFSLFRQAAWKSATFRRLVRGTGRVLSGQTPIREAYGKGNLDEEFAYGLYNQSDSDIFSKSISSDKVKHAKAAKATSSSGIAKNQDQVVRHEDVIYQFSIFENQRWWVGLDWTAALLPQERPSWSDEAQNPVSPPSSFSLPPTKIMLTPAPKPSDPKAFTRRTIKWQWVDPEWTVAGVSALRGGYFSSSSAYRGSAKEATMKAAAAGDKDTISAPKSASIGDSLNRIRAGIGGDAAGSSAPSSPCDVGTTASRVQDSGEPVEDWDVGADGWQYGDNAWEKMSKKSGMGRYTRRRKWVRRAVLLEVVEYGIHGPEPSSPAASPHEVPDAKLGSQNKNTIVSAAENPRDTADTDIADPSTADPETEPDTHASSDRKTHLKKRASLSDRLAKASQ